MEMLKLPTLLTTVNSLILTLFLLLHFPSTQGRLFQPTDYTLPDVLQSRNGSSITGGCQMGCVMMPISGTAINGCDCPGTTPASSVLIDGDIPSIDTTQSGTWASQLFVVNRNGQDSFVIGFEFSDPFFLRDVQVIYFDCSIWAAGVSVINVYSSFIFPTFSLAASTNIGALSLVSDLALNCSSLRTVSVPCQPSESANNYFIEFSFAGGSSVNSFNWLHLGEIRFSDVLTPGPPTTAFISTTTATTIANAATTATTTTTEDLLESNGSTTIPLTTTVTTKELETFEATTTFTATDETSFSTSNSMTTNQEARITTQAAVSIGAAISVPVFVGSLVGVAVVLVSISISVAVIMTLVCVSRRKRENYHSDSENEYDYVMDSNRVITQDSQLIEMNVNEAYGTHNEKNGSQTNNNAVLEHSDQEMVYDELNN